MTRLLLLLAYLFLSCEKESTEVSSNTSYRVTRSISYNNINVDVIIDKPALTEVDVLITYHGTVQSDQNILSAAENTLNQFKGNLNRNDMMVVSVSHPQLNILFGDNIREA